MCAPMKTVTPVKTLSEGLKETGLASLGGQMYSFESLSHAQIRALKYLISSFTAIALCLEAARICNIAKVLKASLHIAELFDSSANSC